MINSTTLVYSPHKISLNIGVGNDSTNPIASINSKVDISILTDNDDTDGIVTSHRIYINSRDCRFQFAS